MRKSKLVLATIAAVKCTVFAHIGETDDQVRAHFKSPPIDQGSAIIRRKDEPKAPAKEGRYLVFLENGWLVWIDFFEGKSVTETWSKTSVANWTSQPIPSQDIENLRKEYGMDAISPGLWGNAIVWMRYDEGHYALMIAAYDFGKPMGGDVWPRLPNWWYLEKARELGTNKSGVLPGKSPPPAVTVATPTPFSTVSATAPTPITTEPPLQTTPAPSQSPIKPLTLVQIAEKIRPSVVMLTAYNSEWEQIKSGTGFFVGKPALIATNWHVIGGANRVTATTSTGEVLQVAGVLRYDPKLDLTLCSVSRNGGGNFPSFTTYTKRLPPMGTRVAVLGNPEGLAQSLSEGIVSAIRRDGAGTLIQITAPISPGSSGSPVVNNTGTLIGIAGATYREGQNLNFARSVVDLMTIWHDFRPQTFADVSKERYLEFLKSDLEDKYFNKYETNSLRERARLAISISEAFPDLAVSYECTALMLIERHDYQRALAELEQARLLLVDTEDSSLQAGLGDLYRRVGQTDRAQECFSRAKHFAKVVREAEAKKSTSSVAEAEPASGHIYPVLTMPPGAIVYTVNGADCHVIHYKAGWNEGDLINTRTGPGQNYSVANKIAIGEKGLVMEFSSSTPSGTTPWVKVYRWNNEKKDTATFIGWVNRNFLEFDKIEGPLSPPFSR
jgi:S1-C subfamily serine protease